MHDDITFADATVDLAPRPNDQGRPVVHISMARLPTEVGEVVIDNGWLTPDEVNELLDLDRMTQGGVIG